MEKLRLALLLLGLAGLFTSLSLLGEHYQESGAMFCDASARVNCDVVNKSPYAQVLGVPVALLGILHYAFVILAAILIPRLEGRRGSARRALLLSRALLAELLFAFLFSLYLGWVQAARIGVFCPLCLFSLALTTTLFILAIPWRRSRRPSHRRSR